MLLHRLAGVALFMLLTLLTVSGCGGKTGETGATSNQGAQQTALEKSQDWYDKKVYGMAEIEARKAGDSVEAGDLLLLSLIAQQDNAAKQAEAETLAQSQVKKAVPESPAATRAAEFLVQRKADKEVEELRQALVAQGADKAKVLADFPPQNRGAAYYGLAFETYSSAPGGAAEDATEKSPAYQSAKTYLSFEPGGPLANKAAAFVKQVDETKGLAKSPLEAFKNAQAAPEGDAAIFKSTKILSAKEEVKSQMGTVRAKLAFTNPYTGKAEQSEVVMICSKRRGAWYVNWSKSDVGGLGPLLGEREHTFSPSGVKGIASAGASFQDLAASLDLVPADVLHDKFEEGVAAYNERQNAYQPGEIRRSRLGADGIPTPIPKHKSEFKYTEEPKLYYSDKFGLAVVNLENPPPILVIDSRYRLANGLGVGSKLADFLQSYQLDKPDKVTSLYATSLLLGGLRGPGGKTLTGVGIDLVPKGVKEPRLSVYVSGGDLGSDNSLEEMKELRVWGMGYVWPTI